MRDQKKTDHGRGCSWGRREGWPRVSAAQGIGAVPGATVLPFFPFSSNALQPSAYFICASSLCHTVQNKKILFLCVVLSTNYVSIVLVILLSFWRYFGDDAVSRKSCVHTLCCGVPYAVGTLCSDTTVANTLFLHVGPKWSLDIPRCSGP